MCDIHIMWRNIVWFFFFSSSSSLSTISKRTISLWIYLKLTYSFYKNITINNCITMISRNLILFLFFFFLLLFWSIFLLKLQILLINLHLAKIKFGEFFIFCIFSNKSFHKLGLEIFNVNRICSIVSAHTLAPIPSQLIFESIKTK